ncbi:MAG TPA: amidohydrolase [bacterium]|nr:amidohydrolase [bacterium]
MVPAKVAQRIKRECRKIEPLAWALARTIFEHPEAAYQEFFAAKALSDFLAGFGFAITNHLGGLKTAFTAEKRGQRRPCLAYLAEMDALPGMGHACGHHLIAAGSAGAAAALSRSLTPLHGSIKVIGCPAEEMGGGKVILARQGAFKNLDAALIIHPDRRTEVYKRALGVVEIEFFFKGRAAHASAEPEKGVNALDAVIQTFNAVNALRQQLPSHVRVHGIVTQGGVAPNIIPERAAAVFLARGLTVKETNEVAAKVIACAQGAAKAAGARLVTRLRKDKFYAPYAGNRALGQVFWRVLESIGVEVKQGPEDEGMGSTDVGNVSLYAPVLHPLLAVPGATSGVHSREFAAAAGGPGGRAMLEKAILANALTGAEVLLNERLRQDIKNEHRAYIKQEGKLPDYL